MKPRPRFSFTSLFCFMASCWGRRWGEVESFMIVGEFGGVLIVFFFFDFLEFVFLIYFLYSAFSIV